MSETDDNLEETYSDEKQYTVALNGKEYHLNEEWRKSIQERAELEYKENPQFSCWWKVASQRDAENKEIHEVGDPILVIETTGPMVPWENLDQLELEMQDTSAFSGVDDTKTSDVDSGNGMRTVKPDDMSDEDEREKNRTHFGITPQDFEEVPSPDGEDPDKIPTKPESFDEPTMVTWVPDNPEIEHTWGAGEAITAVDSWVEWNVQAKAEQPRLDTDKQNSHEHFESLAQMYDAEQVGELQPSQSPDPDKKRGMSGSAKRKGEEQFKDGKFGGNNWNV